MKSTSLNTGTSINALLAKLEDILKLHDPFSETGRRLLDGEEAATVRKAIAALIAEQKRADDLTVVLGQVYAVVADALANADDSEVGWDAEVSASALHEIVVANNVDSLVAAHNAQIWDEGAEYTVGYSTAPLYDNPYRTDTHV